MKKILAAASAAVLSLGLLAAPASAETVPAPVVSQFDLSVDVKKTGGVMGLFGSGEGRITNTGTSVVPAGAVVRFEVHNIDHRSIEPHVSIVLGTGKAFALPSGLMSWDIRTTEDLDPGESASYGWTVLHYAFWHRVSGTATVKSLPGGLTDTNPANNQKVESNGGGGF